MNKFMKKIMSKKDGFTLVELIVVIAILAILAGVAVPAYSGYIKSANEAADQQKLEAIETAMSAALAMEGEDSSEAASYFTASFNNGVLTIAKNSAANGPTNVDDVWENFGDFYGTTYTVSLQYHTAASTIPALLGVVAVG